MKGYKKDKYKVNEHQSLGSGILMSKEKSGDNMKRNI